MITNFLTSHASRFILIASAVLAAMSSGCATLEDALNSAPKPTARIIRADVRNLSLHSLDLVFDVEVSNPYGVNLPLVDLNYAIGSGGLQLLQGGIKPSGSVPAYGSSVMQIPAHLDFPAVMKLLKTAKLGSVIPYTADISVGVDAPVLGLITLPLKRQGEFPIPAVPAISVSSFDIASLSWDEVRATVRLQIGNTNQFQIGLTNLGFDLELDKSNVASIRLRNSSKVEAGKATIVDIPISFLPSAFGAGMFNLLRGSESGYGIAGKLDVDTRFGPCHSHSPATEKPSYKNNPMDSSAPDWSKQLYQILKQQDIRQVGIVPDAGHASLIRQCEADPELKLVRLTTEEEGVALAVGAWLGGEKSVLLMQSSGVGNCINMLSMLSVCQIPLPMIITMRGDWGEFNPWQVPMGHATPNVLEQMGTLVSRTDNANDVAPLAEGTLRIAFNTLRPAALLIGQRLLGAKTFGK